MNQTLNYHTDYRIASRGGAVYLFVEAVIWLLSAAFGALGNTPVAIILLIFGGMFIHPIALGVSHLLRLPKLNEKNDLPILNTWLALMIPLSLPLIFMAVAGGRTHLFYPAFAVIIGIHWLPFTYVYRMKSFTVFAGVFVATGILFGFIVSQPFAVPGFVVGAELLVFAALNSLLVRHEQKTAALENQ
jgi:hypothetical protein